MITYVQYRTFCKLLPLFFYETFTREICAGTKLISFRTYKHTYVCTNAHINIDILLSQFIEEIMIMLWNINMYIINFMDKHITTAVFQYHIFSILNIILFVPFKFCLFKKDTSIFFNKLGKIENNANLKQNDYEMLMLNYC